MRPTPIALALSIALGGMAATPAQAMLRPAKPSSSETPNALIRPSTAASHIVFVDARLKDLHVLTHAVRPEAQVILLQPDGHGLDQIAQALKGRRDLASIAILSHGNRGLLQLGRTTVDTADLARYGQDLRAIRAATAPDGDILLYGCNIGAGSAGKHFIDALSAATGRVVAASTDLTGIGGDWDLEIATGRVHGESVLNSAALKGYGYDLATLTVTSNADNGAGTLRNTITNAAAGDTIDFSGNMTITLSSGQLSIGKNLTIDGGSNSITVDANNTSRVFEITTGNVAIKHLTITGGLLSGDGGSYTSVNGSDALGAGISVTGGTLTLTGDTLTGNHASGGGGGSGYSGPGYYGGGGGAGWANGYGGNGGAYDAFHSGETGTAGTGGAGGCFFTYNAQGNRTYAWPDDRGYGGTSGSSGVGGTGGVLNGMSKSSGGAGATAGNTSLGYIGGGGGASGTISATAAGNGGNAAGALYIASGSTVYMASTSLTNNLGAGGGGAGGSSSVKAGDGGAGIGGIYNLGTFKYQSSTVTHTGNYGAGGTAGGSESGAPPGIVGSGGNTGAEWLVGSGTTNNAWSPPPKVTDAHIRITSTPSGTNNNYKIGDTVTAQWDDSATGDNSSGITSVTMDFSQFGGGSAVVAANDGSGHWMASYTITAGSLDATNRNVSITAANTSSSATTADTSNLSVDNIPPTVTTGNIAISGGTGTGGVFKTGDTVTAQWDNSTTGDNNSDTISAVTVNFSQFGGGTAVAASNVGNIWTATYTLAAGVSGSNKNVSVIALDNAGNPTTTAGTNNATADTVAPITSVTSAQFSNDTGPSSTDFITKAASQTISGTLSANLATGEIVQVSIDNGASWSTATTSVGSNTWSLTGVTLTASNTLKIKVTDSAGNDGPVFSQAYVLDTTVPTNTVATASLSADTGTSSTDFITKTASQTINGTLTTPLASGDVVKVSTDGGSTWSTATATVGSSNWSLSGATLVSGSNTLKVKVSDTAGNDGTVYSQAYTLDTTAPTASVTEATVNNSSSVTTAQSTETGTAYLAASTVAVTDQASLDSAVTAGTATKASVTATNINTTIPTTGLASGTYHVYAVDAAGNVSAASTAAITLDSTAPTAPTAPIKLTAASDTGTSQFDGITSDTSPTLRVSLSGTSGVAGNSIELLLGGAPLTHPTKATLTATNIINNYVDLAVTAGDLGADGSKTFTARVTDNAGNVGPAGGSKTITLDTTVPAVSANTALNVTEAGPATAFTASDLQLTDNTSTAAGLTYTVTSLPTKGTLTLNGNPLAVNATFTQADVDNDLVKYQPTAGQSGADGFGFTASDVAGNTLSGQTASINITQLPKTYTGPTPGGGSATATVSGGGASCGFSKDQFIKVSGDPDSPPAAPPSGYNFQHGLFDFVLKNCTPGGTVTISIDYGQAMPLNTVYWKYGPTPSPSLNPTLDPNAGATPHWYRIPVTASGNTVQFSITDGQLGDDDTSNNGIIVDQGGPAAPINTAGIPALGDWAARLLALMMAGLGWFFIGRRRRND